MVSRCCRRLPAGAPHDCPQGAPTYLALIDRPIGSAPDWFQFTDEASQRDARAQTLGLVDLVAAWDRKCFEGAPPLDPVLRIAPDI